MNNARLRGWVGSIARTLLQMVLALLGLLLCVPLLLLPQATAVPIWVWLSLMLTALFLGVIALRYDRALKGLTLAVAGLALTATLAVVASQAFAMTPAITNAEGREVPGSIAVLETVDLNGSRQWISIRARDATKPVLLFLAGGPGGSQLATARFALHELEDHFVVVNWEQPGSGKSFDAVDRSILTPEVYLEDARALIGLLRERFHVDKVYLLGESWGSALGILYAQRYPQDVQAFVGTGQMVAFLENDRLCYEFALKWADERGDTAKVETLRRQGPPPYYGDDVALKEAAFLMDTFTYMNDNPEIADNGANTFRDLAAPEYGLYDKVSWFRGVIETLGVVYPQLWTVDFRQQVPQLDVPVYFLIGRHDVNAPPALLEEFAAALVAPHKEIVWFEHSGHTPWVSESARFVEVMVDTVLAQNEPHVP